MDQILNLIKYVQAHPNELWEIFASIVAIASVVVNLLPKAHDNPKVQAVIAFLQKLALNKKI